VVDSVKHYVVLKYADAHLYRRAGLSTIKFIVMQVLASNGGSMIPNITTLVERMKGDGLVTTERSSGDKRFVNVMLTDKGRKVLKENMITAQEIINQAMLSISEGDALLLEQSLQVLRENADNGLEEATKLSQTHPGRITDLPSED